jgi:hypothetical protein
MGTVLYRLQYGGGPYILGNGDVHDFASPQFPLPVSEPLQPHVRFADYTTKCIVHGSPTVHC